MTAWEMYWILRLDEISGFFIAGLMVTALALAGTPALADPTFGVNGFKWKIWVICWAVFGIICAAAVSLIPTTNDMKEIYGIEQTQTGEKHDPEISK